jgi:cyanate permease
MDDQKISRELVAELVRAAIFEALCFAAGMIGFFATGKIIWIVIGIAAGLGFSAPMAVKLIRDAKERDRASR